MSRFITRLWGMVTLTHHPRAAQSAERTSKVSIDDHRAAQAAQKAAAAFDAAWVADSGSYAALSAALGAAERAWQQQWLLERPAEDEAP